MHLGQHNTIEHNREIRLSPDRAQVIKKLCPFSSVNSTEDFVSYFLTNVESVFFLLLFDWLRLHSRVSAGTNYSAFISKRN